MNLITRTNLADEWSKQEKEALIITLNEQKEPSNKSAAKM